MNITYKGETKTEFEWSKIVGLSPSCIQKRIVNLGWDINEALETAAYVNAEVSGSLVGPTKTDAERWLNDQVKEDIPKMLLPAMPKRLSPRFTTWGTTIRRNNRSLFDKWFEEEYLPKQK